MRKLRRVGVLVGMAVVVAGCAGGYTAEMYLRPEGVTWPAASKLVTEVRIKGDEDVLAEVGKVAARLGMELDVRSVQRWWLKTGKNGQEGSFSISVGRMKSGTWDVQLADWPGVSRSELSVRAEKEIVAAVHGVVVVARKS
ncbi:MAG TPA: hypothetical protein VM008_18195 [Phycisphaerae bacterium]|nr:hypothetical protein [Phycisphaerae bacterium]